MKKNLLRLMVFLSSSLNELAGVNINTATKAELERLDGIWPIKAQSIINYRKKNGSFKSVNDDLRQVEGVGNATLKNLGKNVSVTGLTTAISPSANKAAKATNPAQEVIAGFAGSMYTSPRK